MKRLSSSLDSDVNQLMRTLKFSSRMASFVMLCLIFAMVIHPSKAHASTIWTPAQQALYSTLMPAFNFNTLNQCSNQPLSPAYTQWISDVGVPKSTIKAVPFNAPSVQLQFNYNGAVCHSPGGSITANNLLITDAGPGIPDLALPPKNQFGLNLGGPNAPTGTYDSHSNTFTLNAPGGNFTSLVTVVTVTGHFKQINEFNPGVYECVGVPTPVTSLTDFGPCQPTPFSIRITILIPSNQPTLSVAASCNGTSQPSTFNVTSGDKDAIPPGLANVYSVHWQLQDSPNGIAWVNSGINVGTTVNEFGGTIVTHGVAFNALPGDVFHRIVATTNGYGVPIPTTAFSRVWGPCRADTPPDVHISANCNLIGPGIPGFTIKSGDPDYNLFNNLLYSVQYIVRNSAGAIIPGGSGVMKRPTYPWNGFPAGEVVHNFNLKTIASYNPTQTYTIEALTTGITPSGAVGPASSLKTDTTAPLNCGVPPPICNGISEVPTPILPGNPFTVTFSIKYTGATPIPNTWTLAAGTSPALLVGATKLNDTGVKTQGGFTATDVFSSSGVPSGSYTVSYTFTSPVDGTVTCPYSLSVISTTSPYLGIYGGDIFAGAGFGSPCTNNPNAYITGSLVGEGGVDQLAAFALGLINSFNSAALRTTPPTSPYGLDFANSPAGTHGNFVGANCIVPDTAPATSTAITVDGPIPSVGGPSFKATMPNLRISASTLSAGQHTKIYVTGNVIITGDITYGGVWAKADDVPSLTLVVTGNIYIDKSVAQLDGTYEAVPTGPPGPINGVINTCVDAGVGPGPATKIYARGDLADPTYQSNCQLKQLTVNGSVVAQHIDWMRTYGSLTYFQAEENPYTGAAPFPPAHPCQSPPVLPNKLTCSGEVIINGPETYIGQGSSNTLNPKFSYFTSLPPVL